jgi:ATP-binding cassette subfamily B protein
MLTALALFARHLKGKGATIFALFALGLAGAASSLATPLIGKTFIDSVVGKGNFVLVPRIALLLLALAVADLIVGSCSRLLHAKLSAAVLVEIRERLFALCLRAPLGELERFRHGDLLNRFGSDIPKIQSLLVDGVLGFMQNVLFLAVAALILLKLSSVLALWSFFGLLLALLITTAFRRPVEAGTRVLREAMVDLSHFLSERLGSLRAVRFHGAQQADAACFAGHNALLVRRMMKFQSLDLAASGLPALTLTVSLAWIYLVGGRLIESGAITLGTFVAFILYQGRLLAPAMGLLGLVRNLQEARVSLERVAELLGEESRSAAAVCAQSETGGIELDRVSFAYPGSLPVLEGLQLRVAEGERVAVFGASGCGKSTLVQILFGLRTPQAGKLALGRTAGSTGQPRLGYAGAEPFLQHASVADNLRYGCTGCSDAQLRSAAVFAEADGFIRELPQGYDTVIGGRGIALSDGQRQRIGLARLFLQDPEIAVLDEAFSALDPETEAKVRRNLLRHFFGRSLLVVSHYLEGLQDFDALYLMEEGRLRQVDESELRAQLGGRQPRPVPIMVKAGRPADAGERRRCLG